MEENFSSPTDDVSAFHGDDMIKENVLEMFWSRHQPLFCKAKGLDKVKTKASYRSNILIQSFKFIL